MVCSESMLEFVENAVSVKVIYNLAVNMLDHPITVVLNGVVFGTIKLLGIKSVSLWVFKIKTSTLVRIINFCLKHSICAPIFSQKVKT